MGSRPVPCLTPARLREQGRECGGGEPGRRAGGADRPVAGLPAAPPRDQPRRHRRAGGPPARARSPTYEAAGLDRDEAFLVAVKRMGSLDEVSREFALEHSERLWKQLVLGAATWARRTSPPPGRPASWWWCSGSPRLPPCGQGAGAGWPVAGRGRQLLRSQRQPVRAAVPRRLLRLETPGPASPIAAAADPPVRCSARSSSNVFPFDDGGSTEVLAAIHVPIASVVRRRSGLRRRDWRSAPATHGLHSVHRRVGRLPDPARASAAGCSSGSTVGLQLRRPGRGLVMQDWVLPWEPRAPSSSPPGWWRRSRTSSRTSPRS